MDILTRPDRLSFSGNIKHFVVSTQREIIFTLLYNDSNETILEHIYSPSSTGKVEFSVREFIETLLSFKLSDSSEPYEQTHILRKFTARIYEKDNPNNAVSYSFAVIRGGIDNPAESCEAFLQANFLTWQPTIKPVTYYTPEFLTYYAAQQVNVCCKAYTTIDSDAMPHKLILTTIPATKVYTIPLQYALIAAVAGFMPAYYDIFIETIEGTQLTYTQRYYPSSIQSEDEQWILFQNSLGGIDTFRAYGATTMTASHTHNTAEIEDTVIEYRVDTTREYKKNTGFLSTDERRWLLDFFPSTSKYIYADNNILPIIVTSSDVSYNNKELPSSYTFTFRYASRYPYLNIPRAKIPNEFLHIDIPDAGSFTLAPRLAELQKLPLSSGAIIPLQGPYADNWSITTVGSLADFFAKYISTSSHDDGALGHTHSNYNLLQHITVAGDYLLLYNHKIAARYADNAAALTDDSESWNYILRKDKPETVSEHMTFLNGITNKGDLENTGDITVGGDVKSQDFSENGTLLDGTGYGMYRDEQGRTHVSADILEARVKATFAELNVKKFSFTSGDTGYTLAGCKVDKVKTLPNGDFRCYYLAENDGVRISQDFHVGDQAQCRTSNIISKVTKNAQNRYYWRLVLAVGEETLEDGNVYYYVDLSNTKGIVTLNIDGKEYTCIGYDTSVANDIPKADDKLVQLGSQTDSDRQYAYIVYVSDGTRVDYNGINDYDLPSHITEQHGVKGTVISTEHFEIKDYQGNTSPIVLYCGQYEDGRSYNHYNSVTCDGSIWLCNVGKGKSTTERPSEDSKVWIKQVDKGGTGYRVEGFASAGSSAYTDGQTDWRATYEMHVWENDAEITTQLPSTRFVWSRVSEYHDGDEAWGIRHADDGSLLSVTYDDLYGDTSFICQFLSADGNKILAQQTF